VSNQAKKKVSKKATKKKITNKKAYLTKSRYVDGLWCTRKLWRGVHQPAPGAAVRPFSPIDLGNRVGRGARILFPGGVEVPEESGAYSRAIDNTRALLDDPKVPALFEAAFEADGVRVRVDILERQPGGWRLCEVKAATAPSESRFHVDDIAVQAHVLQRAGLTVVSAQLIHINRDYRRSEGPLEWPQLLSRCDLTAEVAARLTTVKPRSASMFAVLAEETEPDAEATRQLCFHPYRCPHWDRCIAARPDDWTGFLYRMHPNRLAALNALGIESIRDIPGDFELPNHQALALNAIVSGETYVGAGLAEQLAPLAGPAWYMDFETLNPGIPPYSGTRPFERIPFQWSLHHREEDGSLSHRGFLAPGDVDPRRVFAETLLDALGPGTEPVVVYNQSFERGVLKDLAALQPDLAAGLEAISARVVDLLPIVREHFFHPGFVSQRSLDSGTYSIKNVLNVLVPGLSYDGLKGVSQGTDASNTFASLVFDPYSPEEDQALRQQLRDYCQLDTLAMVQIQDALTRYCTG